MKSYKIILILALIIFSFILIRGFVHSETDSLDIPLEGDPRCLAINPLTNQAIVASTRPNEISVVDLATQTVITTIHVGRRPLGVAIDPELNYGLAISHNDHNLSVINLYTYEIIATIPVGRSPEGIAVGKVNENSHIALITNSHDDSISVVDLDILTLIRTIDVGRRPRGVPGGKWKLHREHFWTMDEGRSPRDVAIDSELGMALVVNERSRNISVIDLTTYEVIGSVRVGREPRAISINPETHLAVVTDSRIDSITTINLQTWQTTSLQVDDHPIDVAVNPLDNSALVLCDRDRSLLLIDLNTNTIIESYTLNKRARGVAINNFTNIAAVIDDKTDSLTLYQLPNPVPDITSINPDTLTRRIGETKVMIEGSGFIKTSTVSSLNLNLLDNHHLEVTIPASLLTQAGAYQLTVTNPPPDGGSSNSLNLQIQ
jgi:YVTN family beta-propeller protein